MKKQTVMAIIVICAVWVIYFAYQARFNPPKEPQQKPVEPQKTEQKQPVLPAVQGSSPVTLNVRGANAKEETFSIKTEHFDCEFNSRGAVISQMILKGLTEDNVLVTVPENNFKAKGTFDFPIYFDTNDFLYGSETDNLAWKVESKSDTDIAFSLNINLNGNPVEIKKHYKLNSANYNFDIEYTFTNKGIADMQLPQFIVSPGDMVGPKLDYENRYNLLNGVYSINGSYEHVDKSGNDVVKKYQGSIDWAGIGSRYILLIMMPFGQSALETIMDNRPNYGYRTGMLMSSETIKARSAMTKIFKVYVGPKDKDILASVDQTLKNAANITLIIEPIRNFVLWCLLKLNKLFKNMGWSLVVFSILTKIVFMPITQRSTDAMKKMGLLAPQINAIKEKYKDKADVMQREIMALYKANKINPFMGCLPILLQMPFFFALYSALANSIDLWNAPFIFWMKDLSMPDTVATISGFNINILPVIMTVSTFFQTKLSTVDTGQSKQQRIFMMAMPVFFIFIFWTMPSGLVLYWIMQNILQITNQLIVNKFGKVK